MADQSMSLMDGTYFVGRKEILDWINSLCAITLSKVEQTCTGAVACQVLDAMYPGKVQMNKVDWAANKDYEYIQNYKVLQKAFMQLKIDKHVEVDRLVRGKYQDNLEFMQWLKAFYERNASGQPYDPVGQREKGKGGTQYTQKYGGVAASGPAAPLRRKGGTAATTRVGRTPPGAHTVAGTVRAARTSTGAARRSMNNSTAVSHSEAETEAAIAAATAPLEKELEELTATHEALTTEGGELRAMVESLEKERDFYFNKLREVEIVLQAADDPDANPLAQSIFKVLYATEEGGEDDEQVAGEPQDEQM